MLSCDNHNLYWNYSCGCNVIRKDYKQGIEGSGENCPECKNCWALNLCSICAADFGEDNDLSASKKLQQYSIAKREVEEHLVEYCTLREYGFNFENQVVIK